MSDGDNSDLSDFALAGEVAVGYLAGKGLVGALKFAIERPVAAFATLMFGVAGLSGLATQVAMDVYQQASAGTTLADAATPLANHNGLYYDYDGSLHAQGITVADEEAARARDVANGSMIDKLNNQLVKLNLHVETANQVSGHTFKVSVLDSNPDAYKYLNSSYSPEQGLHGLSGKQLADQRNDLRQVVENGVLTIGLGGIAALSILAGATPSKKNEDENTSPTKSDKYKPSKYTT